ncbi:hypothetical protein [Arcobacter sp. LA11]|uniref:hypothetical protein n=1 Tax=Arcobacter sp. LA11 TaxID=1898176 RepID=UPI0009329C84|nr:hypothetical protein [Arcobacter sp. LA11]
MNNHFKMGFLIFGIPFIVLMSGFLLPLISEILGINETIFNKLDYILKLLLPISIIITITIGIELDIKKRKKNRSAYVFFYYIYIPCLILMTIYAF